MMTPAKRLSRIGLPPDLDKKTIGLLQMLLDRAQANLHFACDLPLTDTLKAKTPKDRLCWLPKLRQGTFYHAELLARHRRPFGRFQVRPFASRAPGRVRPAFLSAPTPQLGAPAVQQQVVSRAIEISERI